MWLAFNKLPFLHLQPLYFLHINFSKTFIFPTIPYIVIIYGTLYIYITTIISGNSFSTLNEFPILSSQQIKKIRIKTKKFFKVIYILIQCLNSLRGLQMWKAGMKDRFPHSRERKVATNNIEIENMSN